MKIGLDILGGDYAPKNCLEGAVLASKELPSDVKLVLIGDSDLGKDYFAKNNIDSNYLLRNIILVFALLIYCLFFALDFSRKKSIIINTRSKTITSRYSVWSLNFDKRKRATDFEYVAYFEKDKNRIYGVNLWYKENRYFEIGEFDDLISAKNAAYDIARTLKIDLLDATENGNQKWIDVEV